MHPQHAQALPQPSAELEGAPRAQPAAGRSQVSGGRAGGRRRGPASPAGSGTAVRVCRTETRRRGAARAACGLSPITGTLEECSVESNGV